MRKMLLGCALALLVATVGIKLLNLSHAATAALPVEAEAGTTSQGATILSDVAASAGQAVKFSHAGMAGILALPKTIVAVGDSISNAANVTTCCSDNKQFSWSTGSDPAVVSQYLRIQRAQPAVAVKAVDDARSGTKMNSLQSQLAVAATIKPDYVTILMGGNDICTASYATMTATATYQSQFKLALQSFFAASPNSHVFVGSVPNIYYLWTSNHANPTTELVWSQAKVCQSMLSAYNSESDRQAVVLRITEFNAALKTECAAYSSCKYDGDALFDHKFSADEISTVDYFHPSLKGQNMIADVLWAAGYWPDKL